MSIRVAERSDKYAQLLQLADVFDRSGDELRAMAGLGTEVLRDLSAFVGALETMFGGFRERAQKTYELLKTPGTAFVVVAAPEPAARQSSMSEVF